MNNQIPSFLSHFVLLVLLYNFRLFLGLRVGLRGHFISRRNATGGHNNCHTHVKRGIVRGANIIGRTVGASVYVLKHSTLRMAWFGFILPLFSKNYA
jgi:hypothetical protein